MGRKIAECRVIISRHAQQRYAERIENAGRIQSIRRMLVDIHHGRKCRVKRIEAWRRNLGYLKDPNRGGTGCVVESEDRKRLYVCQWDRGELHVCTVFSWKCW